MSIKIISITSFIKKAFQTSISQIKKYNTSQTTLHNIEIFKTVIPIYGYFCILNVW